MSYVLITGASEGIGKAMAYKFASEGHQLILVSRRIDKLNSIKEILEQVYGVDVVVCSADLSEKLAVDELYEKARKYNIILWINNAGVGDYNKVWDADEERIRKLIELNVQAVTTLSLKFVRDNKDKDVTLMNVSSGLGYSLYRNAVAYCASKFYVSAFTEGMAQNLAGEGLPMRVKLLAPGAVLTEFERTATGDSDMDEHEWESTYTPKEMAEAAYRLYCSDKIVSKNEGGYMELQDPLFSYD